MPKSNYKILILGAGAGGISVAAKLQRKFEDGEIAIIDPSENHYYQPLWTVAGAGLMSKFETEKKQRDLIPSGVTWLKEGVVSIDPISQKVSLSNNQSVGYDFLVVATGLKLNWDKIEGLGGNLGKNGICSVYQFDQIDSTARMIQEFQGGTALFVMPPPPIKCAGAPQKIMYLADNIFRDHGIRH